MEGAKNGAASPELDSNTVLDPMAENVTQDGQFGGNNDDGDNCRICRGEATDKLPLFYPCKCSGSIGYVHQDCLMEWLSHSRKKYCELCKTTFRFTKLYDHKMPQTLPLWVFLHQMCIRAVQNSVRWIRYLLVSLVWLAWLPWSIRQVWRALFWLADGSWANGVNAILDGEEDPIPHTTAVLSASSFSSNGTQGILTTIPQTVGFLSTFVELLSSDFLLFKFFRLFYPNLSHWFTRLTEGKAMKRSTLSGVWDRQPSFLSEIRCLKDLTSHRNFNGWFVDVLEGQLICLLIVTGFVLVFLIREWVINEQPAPDAPDLGHVEDVGPAGAEDGPLRGPALRRRPRPLEEAREERMRRVAVPRPLRRLPALNTEIEDAGVAIPAATSSSPVTTSNPSIPGMTPSEHPTTMHDSGKANSDGPCSNTIPAVRPTPPDCQGLHDATIIRNFIEGDSPRHISSEWPNLENFKNIFHRAAGDPAEVLRIVGEENRQEEVRSLVAQIEKSLQRNQTLCQLQANHASVSDGSRAEFPEDREVTHFKPNLEPGISEEPRTRTPSLDQGPADVHGFLTSVAPHHSSTVSPDSVDIITPTQNDLHIYQEAKSDTFEFVHESSMGLSRQESVDDEQGQESCEAPTQSGSSRASDGASDAAEDPNHHPSAVSIMIDWLWGIDDNMPQIETQADEDDEQTRGDVDSEAPFVPGRPDFLPSDDEDQSEANQEANPEVAPVEQDFDFMAAAMGPGIDFNAEAMEEAEELDGLLELIGMQGPLTGMLQNVIFSEVLITLTLAASIWLPYIWGKIALLLLANPIGVFIKAPLHLLSRFADTSVDVFLFILGACLYALGYGLNALIPLASAIIPLDRQLWIDPNIIRKMSFALAAGSGARMEKTIYGAIGSLRPDLHVFSVLSHQALRLFQQRLVNIAAAVGSLRVDRSHGVLQRLYERVSRHGVICTSWNFRVSHLMALLCSKVQIIIRVLCEDLPKLRSMTFDVDTPLDVGSIDSSLLRWSASDRIIAIAIGYTFLTCFGYLYLQISRVLLGLKKDEKVEGIVTDSLNQAGGVMKVILIIGIEMIVFPLYCGLLLGVALMPLFDGADLDSRFAFVREAPVTAFFVHWFVGTCYMFHFALFVSMCRKIVRKGVLYFIRDPDDRNFHPVRDVLERPLALQLRKIAFSGLVYGGLVILCLGGTVRIVSSVKGIFPIHWTSKVPILEFPFDLLFYNLLLPKLIRTVQPSKKLSSLYEWCLRKSARSLRLTNFLFNEVRRDEEGRHVRLTWSAIFRRKQGDVGNPVLSDMHRELARDLQIETYFIRDGIFVRAPGSDSIRIPKGGRVFLAVDECNECNDERHEDEGTNGKPNEDFVKVYIPPMFRLRIVALIVQIWAFAAVTGIMFTILPLSLGRKVIHFITNSSQPPNDLYAFSIGLHVCGIVVYLFSYYKICARWITGKINECFRDTDRVVSRLWNAAVYFCGLAYMATVFGIILPFVFSILVEFYLVIPLNLFLVPTYTSRSPSPPSTIWTPTIHVVQTWTVGLIYLRAVLRFVASHPHPHTRVATAIRSILREGIWRPDVKLATRAFVLPAVVASATMLIMPFILGWMINAALEETILREKTYQYAYPGVLGIALVFYCAILLERQIGAWRSKIRDDVYLIGERLHNFGDSRHRQRQGKARFAVRDGTALERLHIQ